MFQINAKLQDLFDLLLYRSGTRILGIEKMKIISFLGIDKVQVRTRTF